MMIIPQQFLHCNKRLKIFYIRHSFASTFGISPYQALNQAMPLLTWLLGNILSITNWPFSYPEFRKAFKRVLGLGH